MESTRRLRTFVFALVLAGAAATATSQTGTARAAEPIDLKSTSLYGLANNSSHSGWTGWSSFYRSI